jgi:hypothetical protein
VFLPAFGILTGNAGLAPIIDKSADIYTGRHWPFEELLENGDTPKIPFFPVGGHTAHRRARS